MILTLNLETLKCALRKIEFKMIIFEDLRKSQYIFKLIETIFLNSKLISSWKNVSVHILFFACLHWFRSLLLQWGASVQRVGQTNGWMRPPAHWTFYVKLKKDKAGARGDG